MNDKQAKELIAKFLIQQASAADLDVIMLWLQDAIEQQMRQLRWGTLVERVLAVTPDAQIQPHHVLFPIPQDVFERNDSMNAATDQNPGY
tara:strand:- start:5175 stop:5444 length:270 start_codon:yes stop_codon:yes gene_type:complete